MMHAGFVLVGGRSARMGSDKALLPYRGSALAAHLASAVQEAAGSATLIGDPARYASLGYPVHPDAVSGKGPLGGLVTLLRFTPADWNLVVACDMPRLSSGFLRELLVRAQALEAGALCVAAQDASGQLQPLCAVYHRDCLPLAESALAGGRLRMLDLLASLRAVPAPCSDSFTLANVNTPEEWREAAGLP